MARILIIDDDVPLRSGLAMWVASRGHEAVEAADAHSAVIEARAHPPDLVITDVQMPAGGAPMLLQSLQGQEELAEVPVIIMSGMPEAQLKQWFPSTPKRRIHPKPINWNLLTLQISELLGV
ncbi:MAG: response regulator [Elusimicrobia bacterium]|nr:response regulator [Elusimicrobiota bacterium]